MTVSELIDILSKKPSGHTVQINNADIHSVMCFNRVQFGDSKLRTDVSTFSLWETAETHFAFKK